MLFWVSLVVLLVIVYFLGRILEVLIQIRDGKKEHLLSSSMSMLNDLLKPVPNKFCVLNERGTTIMIHTGTVSPQLMILMKTDKILSGSETYLETDGNHSKSDVEKLLVAKADLKRRPYMKFENRAAGLLSIYLIDNIDEASEKYRQLTQNSSSKGFFVETDGKIIDLSYREMDDDLREAIASVASIKK